MVARSPPYQQRKMVAPPISPTLLRDTVKKFAKNIVQAVSSNTPSDNPRTPLTVRREKRPALENSELPARRRREKQVVLQNTRSSPPLQRAKSRINFKVSPANNRESDKENCRLRRSFSPSRLAHRLASPLKSRKSVQKNEAMMKIASGVKQRPTSFSVRFSPRRI
ncbi:hypothetical protein ACS0TY_002150 [Phlomoides rotata]